MARFMPACVCQEMTNWCAFACICSVREINGDLCDQWKLNDEIQPKDNAPTGAEIVKYFEDRGYEVEKQRCKAIEDIERRAENGWRVIVLLEEQRHAVVYWKYEHDNVYVMDPKCPKMRPIKKEDCEKEKPICVFVRHGEWKVSVKR